MKQRVLPVKAIPEMTYAVLGETLHTHFLASTEVHFVDHSSPASQDKDLLTFPKFRELT